ncbi:MAG: alkaline phosphatase family protein [Verrucomicrobiota bacterium]
MSSEKKTKLLLIGWDAADWKSITPLVDAGKMPHLQRLIENGVMGNLATLQPVLSPMLWTSIATGKRPQKHGIHGFSEPDPQSGNIRPITNLSRKTKALWNILNQNNLKTNVVGWWPSHPAEPVHGAMVSNHFQQAVAALNQPWPMRPGTIHPENLANQLADCRIHPWELDGDMLERFIPNARQIDQEKDQRLLSCAKIIAECSGIHAAATEIMTATPHADWDFMAVYYDAIDHFGHGFMKFNPPKQEWVSQDDFDMFKNVIESGYRYHDLMLGTLLELAGNDTTVILMSDHGFHPDALRPQHIPNEPAGPAAEHRAFGIFVAHGPNIKQDDLVFGANLLDITPTILTHFQLPVGDDMDGRPLTSIFTDEPPIETVPSWDQVPAPENGTTGEHPPEAQLDPVDAQEAIDQLVALGYIDEPDENKDQAIKDTVGELKYNLARAYFDATQYHEALTLFAELWEDWPTESRYGVHLFQSQLALDFTVDARRTLEKIKSRKQKYAKEAAEEFKSLLAQIEQDQEKDSQKLQDETSPPINQPKNRSTKKPITAGAERAAIDYDKLDRKTQFQLRKLRARAGVNTHAFIFLEGSLLHKEGKNIEAIKRLQQLAQTEPHNRQALYQKIGEAQLDLRLAEDAQASFQKALELDPINPQARLGLARAHIRGQQYKDAAREALAAAGQIYHNPHAHFLAGLALLRLNQIEPAKTSLKTALAQYPHFPAAHRTLASLYQNHLGDWQSAARHRELARDARLYINNWKSGDRTPTLPEKPDTPATAHTFTGENAADPTFPPLEETITIVSGLPRSGTSMLMQILHAGGLDILTDHLRQADESNRRGYLELEKVKSLGKENPAWLADAKGKAVKIISHFLPRLPTAVPASSPTKNSPDPKPIPLAYRILLIERPLAEITASQSKMLDRLDKTGQAAHLNPQRLADTFQSQLNQIHSLLHAWINHSPNRVAALTLSYHDALAHPAKTAQKINTFLGGSLDESAMAKAIDPSLRHEGTTPSPNPNQEFPQ